MRGHAGIAGNEGADKLAGIGALMSPTPERHWTLPNQGNPSDVGKDANVMFHVRARLFPILQPASLVIRIDLC